jgi:hypothetical protein
MTMERVDEMKTEAAVKERPILMSAPMVRAILAGQKTQTRRIVKPQPRSCDHSLWPDAPKSGPWMRDDIGEFYCGTCGNGVEVAGTKSGVRGLRCPHGQPGDRLWVRETWAWPGEEQFIYRADPWAAELVEKWKTDPNYPQVSWKPSIHMPRRASRITLEVTGVRVERLQDISEEDARAEGCAEWQSTSMLCLATDAFKTLWTKINGAESWAANPYVWCVSFRRVV